MSDAEHLIENVIFAMKRGDLVSDELGRRCNQEMLKNTGIREADLARMASHIVYVLYDGRFPSGPVATNYERITGGNVERFVDWLDQEYVKCAWCDGNCSRYGDGPLPGECEKSTLRYLVDDVVDKTNVWNPFQGGLRYAPLDVDALRKRIETDFGSDWMQKKGQYTPTIALTHCNEVEIPVFGETYRSYKPHEAFKPATGGLIESYKVRELVLGHD